MAGPLPKSLFRDLAMAVATGETIKAWCQKNGVEPATAFDWRRKVEFRQLVEKCRRRAVDRSIGKMAKNLSKAVTKIVRLIEAGKSESVQLSAAKTLIDKLLHVQNHTVLKHELQQLDERLTAEEQRRRRKGRMKDESNRF
jgi:hypothetical protein